MLHIARRVLEEEAKAILQVSQRLNSEFSRAVEVILATRGRVIISGMGKSGIIGKKIAATFSSTGTPSFTVHPGEAYHGDLGMITQNDTIILVSNSGETEEVVRLIPSLRRFGVSIIAMVGNLDSTLARNADVVLDISVECEATPHIQAPTCSTTVTLAMGDALAVALIEQRKFRPQDFAVFHPAGRIHNQIRVARPQVLEIEPELPPAARKVSVSCS
jgi:arabinose-5-phosphate isomerase